MTNPVTTNFLSFPNFLHQQFVDKEGHLTPAWHGILSQLIQTLQNNNSTEGVKLPGQNTSNIIQIASMDNLGTVIYNTQTGKGMLNEAGVFKTIVTS
jgi:hypothetical protein